MEHGEYRVALPEYEHNGRPVAESVLAEIRGASSFLEIEEIQLKARTGLEALGKELE